MEEEGDPDVTQEMDSAISEAFLNVRVINLNITLKRAEARSVVARPKDSRGEGDNLVN